MQDTGSADDRSGASDVRAPDVSADQFYGTLTHAPDGIFVYGHGTIQYVNPALSAVLGCDAQALLDLTRPWQALIHPDDRDAALARLRAMARGQAESDRGIFRIVRMSDERLRHIEVALTRIPGTEVRLVGVVRDVTSRVEDEKALRRHNRLLAGLARATEPLITAPDVGKALGAVREATEVDRASLYVTEDARPGGQRSLMLHAVADRGAENACPDLGDVALTGADAERWLDLLASDGPVCCETNELPDDLRASLSAAGIRGVMTVPLTLDQQVCGMIRLDYFSAPPAWSEAEIAAVSTVAGLFSSVLAQKNAEERLCLSEARFRRLVENAPDFIYRMSLPDGAYQYASPAVEEITGYTPEQIMSTPMHIRKAIHPGWRHYLNDRWERLLQGDAPSAYEYAIIHGKTGETRWVSQRNVLIRDEDGAPIALEGIVTDVTAAKRAEMALRSREATLDSILRAAPIGIGLLSDRVILRVNDRVCQMTGYDREELISQDIRLLYATEADYEVVGEHVYAQIAAHQTGVAETRWQRKDGAVIDILLSAAPLNADNVTAGVTFAALDITDRKREEAQLRALLREAQARLQEAGHPVEKSDEIDVQERPTQAATEDSQP